MEIAIGIVAFIIVIGFIYELMISIPFRAKVRKLSGWITIISWGILIGCVTVLQYVGVYIIYVCLPVGVISAIFWLYLWKNRNIVYEEQNVKKITK